MAVGPLIGVYAAHRPVALRRCRTCHRLGGCAVLARCAEDAHEDGRGEVGVVDLGPPRRSRGCCPRNRTGLAHPSDGASVPPPSAQTPQAKPRTPPQSPPAGARRESDRAHRQAGRFTNGPAAASPANRPPIAGRRTRSVCRGARRCRPRRWSPPRPNIRRTCPGGATSAPGTGRRRRRVTQNRRPAPDRRPPRPRRGNGPPAVRSGRRRPHPTGSHRQCPYWEESPSWPRAATTPGRPQWWSSRPRQAWKRRPPGVAPAPPNRHRGQRPAPRAAWRVGSRQRIQSPTPDAGRSPEIHSHPCIRR